MASINTAPKIPAKLNLLGDFAAQVKKDETILAVMINDADISGFKIKNLALSEVNASDVNFSQAVLEQTNFIDCIFKRCEFTAAVLASASWQRIAINNGRFSGLQIYNSVLKDVIFEDCKMNLVNFRNSKLKDLQFKNCDLTEADFYDAQLQNVSFENCTLFKTEFSGAALKKVDLRTSDISNIFGVGSLGGAIIDSAQLMNLAPVLALQYKITVKDD